MAFEYKVIPAPRKGRRARGVKGPSGRFAYAIEHAINEMASDGWEFVRSETLGADEREGMMRRKLETFHSVLVFKREVTATAEMPSVANSPAPTAEPALRLAETVAPAEPEISKPTPKTEPAIDEKPKPKKPVKKKSISEVVEAQETGSASADK